VPTTAIAAKGLTRRYEGVLAVDGIDLTVARGEIFGLVGPDGAGKTTSIQMLCTLNRPTSGEAKVLGMDTVARAGDIKTKIGYMSERFNLYPTLTVEENLDFFAKLRSIPRGARESRMRELLGFCRLEPFRQRQTQYLSGGMQKKLALACSLIHQPEVLFLDEPTTGVDPVSRRDFWRIIAGFLGHGITVFVSTPYLDEAERFNSIALMHQGRIIACGTPQELKKDFPGELIELRPEDAARALAALKGTPFANRAEVFGDTVHITAERESGGMAELKRLFRDKNVSAGDIRVIAPGLEDVFVTRLAGREPRPAGLDPPSNYGVNAGTGPAITISVSELSRRFGDFTAVDHVNFPVRRGEIFGLLGPNGSGKTTIIRMITGLLEPTSGRAEVLNCDMSSEVDRARCRLGYMSQKFSLFTDLTVGENINFYGTLYGLSQSQLAERREWVLDMAGLKGKEKAMTHELSGGWRQRLALGCTIIHNPQVIFLDEPTSGVDPLSRRSFWELIQDLSRRGVTIFITTHYMDEAEHCHRLGLMYQGRLIALGSPQELKTEQARGELLEVVSSDFARALELLSGDERYRQISLFGRNVHVAVADAATAAPEIKKLLGKNGVTVTAINRIPFSMEDVFISLVEARETASVLRESPA